MITGLDHVLLVCPSLDEAENCYTNLLGREPDWFFSTHAARPYTEVAYRKGAVLVFGSESRGLPKDLLAAKPDKLLTIPSRPQVRSLNLSNCAAIVAYEAVRQWGGLAGP